MADAAIVTGPKADDPEEGEILDPLQSSNKLGGEPDGLEKHSLEHSWTFWFDNPNGKAKQSTWGSSLRRVYTFSTIEDFWCLYNNVIQPSRLIPGADFHCFKDGIEPKWEDPNCASGGKWTIANLRGGKASLDTLWLHTLLAMIGEQFDEGDEICGAVVNVRASHRKIALWTKTASNEAAQVMIPLPTQWLLPSGLEDDYVVFVLDKILDVQQRERHDASSIYSSWANGRALLFFMLLGSKKRTYKHWKAMERTSGS